MGAIPDSVADPEHFYDDPDPILHFHANPYLFPFFIFVFGTEPNQISTFFAIDPTYGWDRVWIFNEMQTRVRFEI